MGFTDRSRAEISGVRQRMKYYGISGAEGYAIAKAYRYAPVQIKIQITTGGNPQEEMERLHNALKEAKQQLASLIDGFSKTDADKAKIFSAHQVFLEDEDLIEEAHNAITGESMTAESAVETAFEMFAKILSKSGDELIGERIADIRDVKNRLLRILTGITHQTLSDFTEDVIVIASDLSPSDTATLDRNHVKGLVTELGGRTSHTAILARSYRIPAIVGCKDIMNVPDGALIALDAVQAVVTVEPDENEIADLKKAVIAFSAAQKSARQFETLPAKTLDNKRVQLGINIGAAGWDDHGQQYDFIGLFRTEFLFMERDHMPTEEEQFEVYRMVLRQARGKTVTLRTMDIGGDKSLPYYELPNEDNPFLGLRALRLCFAQPEILLTQLCAALRASAFGNLQIMFPMVTCIADFKRALTFVETAKQELRERGEEFDGDVKLGIMIEVPAIALMADQIAKIVDFASVGTNDLCQYVCAADRLNANVRDYYQNMSPALLRLLAYIIDEFNKAGTPVSVCGEMGGDPLAALVLSGLGLKKLSMNEADLVSVKTILSRYTLQQMRALANSLLRLEGQMEVCEALKSFAVS